MYNNITLIGTMVSHPQDLYDTDGNRSVLISLKVTPPPDAPPTYWGGVYDLRGPDWPRGDDIFLVICRDRLLVERCMASLHKGALVCIEGRLVLTLMRSDAELVPLAEILARDVVLLKEAVQEGETP